MKKRIQWMAFLILTAIQMGFAQERLTISGRVTDQDGVAVAKVLVVLKENNKFSETNSRGEYLFANVKNGDFTLEVNDMGYYGFTKKIVVKDGSVVASIQLEYKVNALSEINITAKDQIQQIKEKAFNVAVIDAVKLHHTTMDIGHALNKVSGMRVRESGGVGSTMNFSMNGYGGNQIKFFLDGIPMDHFGSAFQLNNIPINLAKRIEVYKGVVPVGLGSDALGGAVNIITNNYSKTSLDLSYSYGSFNTHRSNVNFIYAADNGFFTQINAFQNFSDNDYKVKVDLYDLNSGKLLEKGARVKRFHDQYHNETFVGQVGLIDKKFADKIAFGITLGQSYKEIQTGARMETIFGGLHHRANIVMPSFVYQKKNFLLHGLSLNVNANYNLGTEQNIDTLYRRYGWTGDYIDYKLQNKKAGGERDYSMYKYKNNNGMLSSSLQYQLGERHGFALSNTLNFFNRKGSDELFPEADKYEQPAKTTKNISGLSYQFVPNTTWSASAFVKYYNQVNKYSQSYNPSGKWGDIAYEQFEKTYDEYGYGLTASYFIHDNFQLKASFEKAIRLPDNSEIFGDMINMIGDVNLRPEISDNYNFGFNLQWPLHDHRLLFDTNLFYRDSKDFIRQKLDFKENYQMSENLAAVINYGIEAEWRYLYKDQLSVGINGTYQKMLNNTPFVEGVQSLVYKDRLPNVPYLYGNADASYTFKDLWAGKSDNLSFGYSMMYIHEFYLLWPSQGDKNDGKRLIPEQLTHDLIATYTLGEKEKFQFTIECRNLGDKMVYDNFSLQKPGRSFSGKVRYFF
ncbi:TonB-dependent receptor [Flavobacterium sp. JP2137]|uniref:TonB-dependent receptor n=1 Tax=Flavobacterium sp. JP2137 TaxID=3414510 RepID=UPI003D2FF4E3